MCRHRWRYAESNLTRHRAQGGMEVKNWSELRRLAAVAAEDGPWEPSFGMTDSETEFATAATPFAIIGLIAERDQLRAEVDSLRNDAERYRWLRDRHDTPGDYLCVTDGEDGVIIEETVGFEGLSLDAAIDAAMAAKEG